MGIFFYIWPPRDSCKVDLDLPNLSYLPIKPIILSIWLSYLFYLNFLPVYLLNLSFAPSDQISWSANKLKYIIIRISGPIWPHKGNCSAGVCFAALVFFASLGYIFCEFMQIYTNLCNFEQINKSLHKSVSLHKSAGY